jgi:hypothetical protein
MTTLFQIQKPENVVVGLNVNYTVPAGMVAKVAALISVSNYASQTAEGLNTDLPIQTGSAASDSQKIEMVLRAGDILSSTRTTGSTSGTVSFDTFFNRSSVAICTLLVNAANSCTVRAPASISGTVPGSSGNATFAVTGTADMGFVAEEYFE